MGLASWFNFPVRAGRSAAGLNFTALDEQQILSLAIALEEDDARIYNTYADILAADYPDTAQLFRGMAAEEDGHRHRLIELYRQRFGERILLSSAARSPRSWRMAASLVRRAAWA